VKHTAVAWQQTKRQVKVNPHAQGRPDTRREPWPRLLLRGLVFALGFGGCWVGLAVSLDYPGFTLLMLAAGVPACAAALFYRAPRGLGHKLLVFAAGALLTLPVLLLVALIAFAVTG
jgi:hypothetical protein